MTWGEGSRLHGNSWTLLMLVVALFVLTTGCSAQVAGMSSPVFHDYGEVEWVPLDREIEQRFIAGTGYSAAIENDQSTSSYEFTTRLSELPEDATTGDLTEIRIGVRLADGAEGAWDSGASLAIATMTFPERRASAQRSEPLAQFEIDRLPRSGELLMIADLPVFAPGDIVVLKLNPGDGEALEIAVTPHRAPYAGWRATSGGKPLQGSLVFETRYQREVAVGEVVGEGLDRMTNAGGGFILFWMVACGGLLAGIVLLSRKGATDGR